MIAFLSFLALLFIYKLSPYRIRFSPWNTFCVKSDGVDRYRLPCRLVTFSLPMTYCWMFITDIWNARNPFDFGAKSLRIVLKEQKILAGINNTSRVTKITVTEEPMEKK